MTPARLVPLFLIAGAALAHPPKQVAATYDRAVRQVVVTVQHPVADPKIHFIDVITVSVDGREVARKTYTEQGSAEVHETRIEVGDLKPGSRVEVKASCNKMGSRKAGFTTQ